MNLMKINVLIGTALLSIAACRGPEGMPGPPGPPGPRGEVGEPAAENLVFEVEGINFTAPDYNAVIEFLPEDEVLISDVVLVYFLWDSFENGGEIFDVWRPLPITSFLEEGTMVYTFDYTDVDVSLFLDANFDIASAALGPSELADWVARVVVIRAEYDEINGRLTAPVDLNDYNAVKEYYSLPDVPRRKSTIQHARPSLEEK